MRVWCCGCVGGVCVLVCELCWDQDEKLPRRSSHFLVSFRGDYSKEQLDFLSQLLTTLELCFITKHQHYVKCCFYTIFDPP